MYRGGFTFGVYNARELGLLGIAALCLFGSCAIRRCAPLLLLPQATCPFGKNSNATAATTTDAATVATTAAAAAAATATSAAPSPFERMRERASTGASEGAGVGVGLEIPEGKAAGCAFPCASSTELLFISSPLQNSMLPSLVQESVSRELPVVRIWSASMSDRITDAQLCALAASVSITHISPILF